MNGIVGRGKEFNFFKEVVKSAKSEFVAVYGRRRVGKTVLIRSVFDNRFTFQITGIGNATLAQQLMNFNIELQKVDDRYNGNEATSWQMAFQYLIRFLEDSKEEKKVVFFDELPWFDTPKSNFISALEHFWNNWASARNDVVFIVCGSAASWMVNKLINNKAGLHNRITKRLKLLPFTLKECEQFLQVNKIVLARYQIVQLYMVMGGIPYYWEQVHRGYSAMQNIEKICFAEDGVLRTEFKNLFKALFSNSERHLKIVKAIMKKAKGLSRDEIVEDSGLPNGGSTTKLLEELEKSGFIRKYHPFGKKMRNSLYQLVDFYTLFYFRFIENASMTDENYWMSRIDSPSYRAWSGYAFEQVCLYHLPQIKKALGVSGVQTSVSSWRSSEASFGAQIDLVIDRRDHVVNLCEMKFSIGQYIVDKRYAENLRNKVAAFKHETKTRKSVFLTFVSTFGLKENMHSVGLVQNEITIDHLFE